MTCWYFSQHWIYFITMTDKSLQCPLKSKLILRSSHAMTVGVVSRQKNWTMVPLICWLYWHKDKNNHDIAIRHSALFAQKASYMQGSRMGFHHHVGWKQTIPTTPVSRSSFFPDGDVMSCTQELAWYKGQRGCRGLPTVISHKCYLKHKCMVQPKIIFVW